MSHKAIYRNTKSGDLFAIETDEKGAVLSTSGPLLFKELDPKVLDYDEYWNMDVTANIADFQRLSKAEYLEILYKNGFIRQSSQKRWF
jgi:beta-mannanase